ncbi:MAG: hypothetical protein J5910_03260 [Lachnospiraceae bacterium]|nr:hypothetical protein [Lachnospiraceae bacterium]
MKRIRSIITSRFGFAFLTNFITVISACVLFRPFWEESDDVGMALLAEGVYGYFEPHLNYSSIIYGDLLCLLARILPMVRWHAVIMYLVSFVVGTAFTYILSKNSSGRILSVIYLIASGYELYVALQFSKIAAVIGLLSYMILFDIIKNTYSPRIKRILTVIAVMGTVFSNMIRLESFLLATMIAGIYGIWLVVSDCINKRIFKTIKTYLLYFVPVFALFGIGCVIDHAAYSSQEWNEYMSYFYSAANMADYHNEALVYDLHGEELAGLGVSENDALMLITYEYSDEDFLTKDLMNSISLLEPKGLGYIDSKFLKAWIANLYEELARPNSVVIAVIMILGLMAAAVLRDENRLYLANVLSQLAVAGIVLFYYQYSGRFCHRVVYTLLLAQLAFFVYLISDMGEITTEKTAITCILLMLGLSVIGHRLGNEFDYREDERRLPGYDLLVSYMEDNKDHLFVGDVFTMLEYGKYDVFRPGKKGQFDNYLSTDLVLFACSPVNHAIMEKYGYNDTFKALSARDERVILIDNISPEVELDYCREHGDGGEYELKELSPVGEFRLYNIR